MSATSLGSLFLFAQRRTSLINLFEKIRFVVSFPLLAGSTIEM
jgi:hypothetical protein